VEDVTLAELRSRLDQGGLALVDVRTRLEFDGAVRIERS
jgi:hypothetical protein